MAVCLSFDDILHLGTPRLAQLLQVGDSFDDVDSPGACEAFTKQVRLLEGFIIHTNGVAVSVSKRADDLAEVAAVWEHMGAYCGNTLHTLARLKDKSPDCGTPALYDLVLDYKLACEKRFRSVIEEMECQNEKIPAGLFPATR
jgi:hypothetical protein